jgi:hypothetical protein
MTNYEMKKGTPTTSGQKRGPKHNPMYDVRRAQLIASPNEWFVWSDAQKHRGVNGILTGLMGLPAKINVKRDESPFKVSVRVNDDTATHTVYVKYVASNKEKK